MNAKMRLRLGAAQIGLKTRNATSLGMLLDVLDLPGTGWKVLDERTRRTGFSDPRAERSIRARAIGSVMASRSFHREDPYQALWTQVSPFDSIPDAQSAVGDSRSSLLPNLGQRAIITYERAVGEVTPLGIEDPWVYEQSAESTWGSGVTRIVCGRVDRSVIAIACTARDNNGWSWADISALATLQAEKVLRREFDADLK